MGTPLAGEEIDPAYLAHRENWATYNHAIMCFNVFMPRGKPPQWRKRNCDWCHLVKASVALGFRELVYDGIDTAEQALEVKRGVFRARNHGDHFTEDVSAWAEVEGPDDSGKYQVRLNTAKRAVARKYVTEKYGSKEHLPYNPFAKMPRDENGKAIYE
jgi:hypothetical protein